MKAPIAKTQDWMQKKKEQILNAPLPNLGPIPLGPSPNMTVRDSIDAAKDNVLQIVGMNEGGERTNGTGNDKGISKVENIIDGLEVIDDKVLGKIPLNEFTRIRKESIINPNADSIVLGKYTPTYESGVPNWGIPGPDSYISKAGNDSTYFSLGSDWDKIKKNYNLTDKDMFNIFNVPALDDAVLNGKTIKFSHNPSLDIYEGSALADEWKYLQTKYGYKSLKEVGGFWIAK